MTAPEFRGIYPMLYAFFNADGTLDRTSIERQVEACVNGGAHGVAALGLATEIGKLTAEERIDLLAWTADALAGRLPLAVTIAEATVEGQVSAAQAAQDHGAAWVILQPPSSDISETDLARFFGAVADRVTLPIAIQNAPEYIGAGLGPQAIKTLHQNHSNFRLLKGEGPVLTIRRIIEESDGTLAVFNGRAGLELTDNLRAGCSGMIPGIEGLDVQSRIFDLMASGNATDEAEAERLYADILPLIVFVMQSLDTLLCYGKRVAARRLGLGDVHDRQPAEAPTAFGLACVERHAARFGRLP